MSDEIKQGILDILTRKSGRGARIAGYFNFSLDNDDKKIPQRQIDKALKALVEEGNLVTLKGHEIPWNFYDKRPASTYYMTPEYREAQLKDLAEAAENRRLQKAADEADLTMRQLHPKEWDALKAKFYKEIKDKEYKG